MRNIYIFLTLMISFVSHSWGQGNTCATATTLTAAATCTYTAGTTVGATYQSNAANGGVPSCASPGAPDVFYVFTTTVAGNYTFDSNTGTITDGGMAIYSGACGSLTQVACDDDSSPNGAMPMITASLAAGTTFRPDPSPPTGFSSRGDVVDGRAAAGVRVRQCAFGSRTDFARTHRV